MCIFCAYTRRACVLYLTLCSLFLITFLDYFGKFLSELPKNRMIKMGNKSRDVWMENHTICAVTACIRTVCSRDKHLIHCVSKKSIAPIEFHVDSIVVDYFIHFIYANMHNLHSNSTEKSELTLLCCRGNKEEETKIIKLSKNQWSTQKSKQVCKCVCALRSMNMCWKLAK